jgi:hypothetical protein
MTCVVCCIALLTLRGQYGPHVQMSRGLMDHSTCSSHRCMHQNISTPRSRANNCILCLVQWAVQWAHLGQDSFSPSSSTKTGRHAECGRLWDAGTRGHAEHTSTSDSLLLHVLRTPAIYGRSMYTATLGVWYHSVTAFTKFHLDTSQHSSDLGHATPHPCVGVELAVTTAQWTIALTTVPAISPAAYPAQKHRSCPISAASCPLQACT